jgi:hypothetical protein
MSPPPQPKGSRILVRPPAVQHLPESLNRGDGLQALAKARTLSLCDYVFSP